MNAPGTIELLRVLGGIGLLLLLATAIGRWLAARRPPGRESAVIDNLNARIDAWWIMVLLLGAACLAGRLAIVLLFALLSFGALRELLSLMRISHDDRRALMVCFVVVLTLQYAMIFQGWYGLYSIFIPVYAFLFLPIVAALRGQTERFLVRVAETQWALMLAVFCLSHVPALLTLQIPSFAGRDVLLIVWLVVTVQISDVLQYTVGKLVGRRPVAPGLSPSKTVEGTLGGIALAVLIGAGLWWITPFGPLGAAALALIVTLMGFLGGLVMSAIKRDRGVKDWGRTIPGHGGVIDRLDSVLFAAPVFFHLVRYLRDVS